MKIPAYFDSNFDHTFKNHFNGFDKNTYAELILKNSKADDYHLFVNNLFDFDMPIILGIPFEKSFEYVNSDHENFFYPIQVHWWMQSNSIEFWKNIKINENILKAIEENRCKILLYNTFEGWELEWWRQMALTIMSIYQNLRLRDFIVTSNNVYINDSIIKNIPLVNTQRQQTAGVYGDFEAYKNIMIDRINNQAIRKYRFVCLNRKPTLHRWATVTLLYDDRSAGLLSYSLDASLTINDSDANFKEILKENFVKNITDQKSWLHGEKNNFKITMPNIFKYYEQQSLENDLPLLLDNDTDVRTNPIKDDKVFKFTDSYLHIVTETYFIKNNTRIHLSEKIFKPIWFMQPFVIVAQPGSLKELKKLGYQTFDKWIDEDYDNEEDNELRVKKAIQSAKDFYRRPIDDLNQDMKEMLPVLIHNHDLIRKYSQGFDFNEYIQKLQGI